jgi:23S rRNA (uracil1939-C5)-methyltransferase
MGPIDSELDRAGRGVMLGEDPQPDLHVFGALAGERVTARRLGRRGDQQVAVVTELHEASPRRVEPGCPHHGVCGGCTLQHMSPEDQRAHKQSVLSSDFAEHGVTPSRWLDPIFASDWGYRRRARLGVRAVDKKNRVLVGFRELVDGRLVADDRACPVLAGGVGDLFDPLSSLIDGLSLRKRVPQIEVAVGDGATALVFRVLDPPTQEDRDALLRFGIDHDVRVFTQTGGLDTVRPIDGGSETLRTTLVDHDVTLEFRPTDFLQVNAAVNRAILARALTELQLEAEHRVLDLFCGLGNFTLPLARRVARVVGVEGDAGLVERARHNAKLNEIGNAVFHAANLYAETPDGEREAWPWAADGAAFDRVLLDPPRTGAEAILPAVAATGAARVVYVACSPSTLARDVGILVREHGYTLEAAGVADMFPHTAHVESLAVLARA